MIAILLALLAVVNVPNPSVSYTCDGSTAVYTVNFPYLVYTDLQVTNTTPAGIGTTLAYTTDFTVNLASTSSTATLTLTSPGTKCPSGNVLKIARNLALTQPYGFKAQTTYNQNLHEQAYDREVMLIQQTDAKVAATDVKAYVDAAVSATLTGGQNVQPLTWNVTGDGAANVFSISNAVVNSPDLYIVTIDGVFQRPVTDYTVSTATAQITFASVPALNAVISVRSFGYARALSVGDNTSVLATGSSVPIDLAHRFSYLANVVGFGADSTGVVDATASFQSTHTSLPSAGGVIFAPPGTYKLTTVNITKSDVRVVCAQGSILQMTGAAGSPMFNVTASGRVTFEGCTVQNTRHGRGPAFYFSTVARGTGVYRTRIDGQDFYTIGVQFIGGCYGDFVRDVGMVRMGRGIGVLANAFGLNLSSLDVDNVIVDFGTLVAANVNTIPDTLLDNLSITSSHVQAQADPVTSALTTLNGGVSAGVSSIVVASSAGMAVGNQVLIGEGTAMEHNKISGIAGTTVTLQLATANAYSNGVRVLAANLFGVVTGVNVASTTIKNLHSEVVAFPIYASETESLLVIQPQLTSFIDGMRLDPVLEFALIGGDFGTGWTSGVHITNKVGGWGIVSARQVLMGQPRFRDATASKYVLDDRAGAGTVPIVLGGRVDALNQILTNTLIYGGVTFGTLGAPANGRETYCSDCTIANPCAGAGTGAIAKRLNGVWVCN